MFPELRCPVLIGLPKWGLIALAAVSSFIMGFPSSTFQTYIDKEF